MKSKFTLCLALLLLAVITSSSGQNDSQKRLTQALEDYQAALNRGDSSDIAEKSYILGKRYLAMSSVFPAKRYFLQALKIREAQKQYLDIGKIYARLRYTELLYEDFAGADLYSRLAFENFRKDGTPFALRHGYMVRQLNFSNSLEMAIRNKTRISKQNIDSLDRYSGLALTYCRLLKDTVNEGVCYRGKGLAFFARNRFDSAIISYQKAFSFFNSTKITHVNQMAGVCFDLSRAYLHKGDVTASTHWFGKGVAVADTAEDLEPWAIVGAYQAQMLYYQKTGNLPKALEYEQKTYLAKNRFYQHSRQSAEEGLQLFFDNEQKQTRLVEKEEQLALEQRSNRIRSWLIAVATAFLLFAIAASIVLYRLYKKFRALSKENAMLLDEQNHRIKNNLQSVRDLLELQSIHVHDPKALGALEESMMRVEAIARVHQELYDGGRLIEVPLEKYIPDLVRGVLKNYSRPDVKVVCELDAVWLHGEKAVPLGLILNELITNACKYAFSATAEPKLVISCHRQKDEIGLVFRDNGGGFAYAGTEASGHPGTLGLTLIRLLAGKLKGKYRFTSDERGTAFQLTFSSGTRKNVSIPVTQTVTS